MKKQKNTMPGGTKTGKNRRNSTKYPALNQGLNLSSRREYIESDYVDGVFDKEGNLVIRPLNDKEKEFLNQFYEESVITNFYHHPELKTLQQQKKHIIEDDLVQALKHEVKILSNDKVTNKKRIREIKEIIKITKKQNEETYAEDLLHIEEELEDIRQEFLLYPDKEDHKLFYNDNNTRNSCLYNKMKMTNRLIFLEPEEYDMFVSKKLQGLDTQHLMIYDLERSAYEAEEERLEEVIKEEKLKNKTKSSK